MQRDTGTGENYSVHEYAGIVWDRASTTRGERDIL